MRSCITHFSWPDTGLCEVPSKPTLAKAKGVGQYMCVFLCKCVCVCMCICTHKTYSVLGYKCVSVFACALKKIYLSVYLITFHFYFFSWQSCEHRASLHKGKAGRGVCIYLTDAYPDPQRRGHKHSHPGSFAGSHGSRAVRQQSAGVIVWKVSGHAL